MGSPFTGPQTESFCSPSAPPLEDLSAKHGIPVRPLLVQNAVSALLATDGIALLERDFGIAVTTQVVHWLGRVLVAACTGNGKAARGLALGERASAGGDGRWFVSFARHYCAGWSIRGGGSRLFGSGWY